MDDWIKAGKIAGESLKYGKSLAKPGIKLLELADKIEAKIIELGGKPAFPVNLSLNHLAAHYAPPINDETILGEEDLLKIDVGAHVNGYVGDTALTVGSETELIKASEDALNAALKICEPGTKLMELGRAIQDAITGHGFSPIKNLSGHGITKFKLHSGVSIPNYDNGNETGLVEGQVIAIEPFATSGVGKVMEGKPSGIYRLSNPKPTRNPTARQLMSFMQKEYNGLPFARRWILRKFPNASLALAIMEREGILHQYNQLPEESKALVSQAEHTIIIGDKSVITTKV
jgi:methionyl aminopeptidase